MTPAEANEETLRICLSCQHYLQKRCDFIAFERLPKHSLIQQYDVSRPPFIFFHQLHWEFRLENYSCTTRVQ